MTTATRSRRDAFVRTARAVLGKLVGIAAGLGVLATVAALTAVAYWLGRR